MPNYEYFKLSCSDNDKLTNSKFIEVPRCSTMEI